MQADHNTFLSLSNIYPCAPRTKRGDFSSLDIQNGHFLYFNGPTVILRPINRQQPLKYFIHKSDVLATKFSYDGKLIASIDEKGTLMIHELGQKELFQIKKYENFYPNAKAIDWSADKKRICVVGAGKQSFGRVVLVQAGTNLGQISGVSANLTCCSFRPERPYHLVVGGDEFVLKYYQGPPYKFIKSSQKSHSNYINSIKHSPSGKYFISVSSDKKLIIYNGQNFEMLVQKSNCHQRSILGADWIDDKTFVTISADKSIKLWNIELQQLNQIKCCEQKQFKDSKSYEHFQVAVKVYQGFIYSLGLNGEILRFMVPLKQDKVVEFNSEKIQRYAGWVGKPLAVLGYQNQNEQKVLVIDSSGKVLEIQQQTTPNSPTKLILLPLTPPPPTPILQAVSDPQSGTFTILYSDGSISLFTITNSQLIQKMKIENAKFRLIGRPSLKEYSILGVSTTKINAFSTKAVLGSPEIGQDSTFVTAYGDILLVGTLKGNLHVFNGQNLQFITKMKLSSTKISYIYVERSTKQSSVMIIICGDALGKFTISYFDKTTKCIEELSNTLGNHESMITAILGYNNSQYLVTCGMDNKINLWLRVQQGRYSRQHDWRNTHQLGITSAEIINNKLFTIGGDYLVKQWTINI